jgi:hypothetical protein
MYTNSVLAATLDSSGNLGIGTSSPASKLHVNAASGSVFAQISSGSNDLYLGYDGVSGMQTMQSDTGIYFATGASFTERMRLDSSGNLGLGVTPSVGYGKEFSISGDPASGVGGLGARPLAAGNNILYLANNAKNTGAFTDAYWTSAPASKYAQNQGVHQWLTAPSGTAGNAITFTQAMTLDASGNLLIGRTSGTGANLDVYESASNDATIRIGNVQNAAVTAIGKQGATSYGATTAGDSFLYSDGFLSIMADNASGVIKFSTGGNTERARITSAGAFIVGDTGLVASSFAGVKFDGAVYNGLGLNDSAAANTAGYIYFQSAGTTIGSITRVGATSAVAYNTVSDQRLKENIQDAAPASAVIDALQVREYDWKSDGTHQRYGFIAQELVTVAPEAVHQPADPEEMMAVDYSKLVPMLVKEIQSLRQRVAQLEGA